MLCESCHQREATCHVTAILGDVIQKRDLCPECFEASSPDARGFASAQRDARCEYCGGQLCAGGTDFLAMVTGVQKLKFMCMPCSVEHNPLRSGRIAAGCVRAFSAGATGFASKTQRASGSVYETVGFKERLTVRLHHCTCTGRGIASLLARQ